MALSKFRVPVASLMLSGLVVGCDNDQGKADKKVAAQLRDAQSKNIGKPLSSGEYSKALEGAAQDATASRPQQIQAKVLLAHEQLRKARALAADFNSTAAEIDRLSLQVQVQTRQIERTADDISNLNLSDPAKAPDQPDKDGKEVDSHDYLFKKTPVASGIQTAIDTAKGTGDSPWVANGPLKLGSASAAAKEMSALQSKIEGVKDDTDTATAEQKQLLADADKIGLQAESQHGKKGIDLFVQASEDRRKAADLSVKIDRLGVTKARLEEDLASAKAQQNGATAAADELTQTKAQADTNWQDVQGTIAKYTKGSKDLVGSDSDTAPEPDKNTHGYGNGGDTIASKLATIQKLVAKNRQTAADAQNAFNSAIGFYKAAQGLATQEQQELSAKIAGPDASKNPSLDAWQAQKVSLSPMTFQFYQADAQLALAQLLARDVESRLKVGAVADNVAVAAQKAGVELPKVVEQLGTSSKELDALELMLQDSNDKEQKGMFKNAYDGFNTVMESSDAPPARKTAAKVAAMYALYDWSAYNTVIGKPDIAALRLNDPSRKYPSAAELLKVLRKENATLPPLPADLVTPSAASAGGGGVVPSTAAPDPTQVPAGLAGTYKGSVGVTSEHFQNVQTLELKPDGTFTFETDTHTDLGGTPHRIDNKSIGTYTGDPARITLVFVSMNGKAVPANDPKARVTFTVVDGGKELTGDLTMIRQP